MRLPFSKKILLPVEAVTEIDWVSRQVVADVPAERIEDAPPFDPSEPINERLETVLYERRIARSLRGMLVTCDLGPKTRRHRRQRPQP